MKFTALNDNGPNETLFRAICGYNVQITKTDGETISCQIVSPGSHDVSVQLFVEDEDEPAGEVVSVEYDDIEEIGVH